MRTLVTAALIYSNGEIHLGHLRSTYLPADVYTRYLKSSGKKAIYVCATDDHGTPALIKAEQEGRKPEEYTRYWHDRDEKEFRALGLDFDVFHRTHSPENKEATIQLFEKLRENGYIYQKEVKEYYCEHDKKYLADRYVKGKCPSCGAENQYSDQCEKCGKSLKVGDLIKPRCTLCKKEPVLRESEHYFFKLSAFSKKISAWFKKNKELQQDIVGYVKNWIKEGLIDWDMSRNLKWGFKIPGSNQVFYVWFDAPIGYISSTKKWAKENKEDWKKWWGKETKIVHFIGKDIIYHHYLFWPAMLMGAGDLTLPTKMPARGFLNLEGQKFSKSRGNYVSLKEYLQKFDPDHLRFYMTLITPNANTDGNWNWKDFMSRVNSDLIGNVGNFLYRTTYFINKYFDGQVPSSKGPGDFVKKWKQEYRKVTGHMERVELKKGLEGVLKLSGMANKYFQDNEPWKLIKNDKKKAGQILSVCANACKNLCSLMFPFTPFAMKKLSKEMKTKIDWKQANQFNKTWRIGKTTPAFKKIECEQIKKVIK